MRQKRTFLLLSVIVATLTLAVAYAAITNIGFNISGTATANPYQGNFKVAFVGTPTLSGDGASESSAEITGDLTAKINVGGISKANEMLYVHFTIKNSSEDIYAIVQPDPIGESWLGANGFAVNYHVNGEQITTQSEGDIWSNVYYAGYYCKNFVISPKSEVKFSVSFYKRGTDVDDIIGKIADIKINVSPSEDGKVNDGYYGGGYY